MDWSEGRLPRIAFATPTDREPGATVRIDAAGRAQVVVSTFESALALLPALQTHGFEFELASDDDRELQGRVRARDLQALAQVAGVRFVAPPLYGVSDAGSKLTQGDATMKSDSLRSLLGATGAGVSIGVVQMGAAGYAQSQASGDLPPDLVRHSLRSDGSFSTTESEGLAMLEIIHDVAPDAKLYYAEFETSLEFAAAYNWLAARCQVVVDDISFFNAGPYDGTSAVSQAVASVASRGVAAFGSVGNRAQLHTSGVFNDPDGNGFHNFSGAADLQRLSLGAGGTMSAYLQWNEPFGGATSDYDLYLFDLDATGNPQITSGVTGGQNTQNGTQNPIEALKFTNTGTTTQHVGLALRREPGGATRSFDIFFAGVTVNQYIVSAGSVPNKGDAGGGFVSVGAANYSTPGTIASYSSRGPTKDGRMKPEITAPDCVTTTVDGFAPFCGTSAAAPHAAAVAALLLSRKNTLTPPQVLTALESTAADMGTPGPDNDSGYGFINALSAGQSINPGGGGPSPCVENATTMCLVNGRYQIRSHWKNQYAGGATATLSKAKLTDATGAFWIADASAYEYLIRFNTATTNGRIWIVIATFTDVEFWIDVTDNHTGQSNEYHSAAGNRTLIYDPFTFPYP